MLLAVCNCVNSEGGGTGEGPDRTFAQSQYRNSTACESEATRHYYESERNHSEGVCLKYLLTVNHTVLSCFEKQTVSYSVHTVV